MRLTWRVSAVWSSLAGVPLSGWKGHRLPLWTPRLPESDTLPTQARYDDGVPGLLKLVTGANNSPEITERQTAMTGRPLTGAPAGMFKRY